jgi:cytochrome c551/c552
MFSNNFARALLATAVVSTAHAVDEPEAFTINCKACHLLDQSLVGPSLVELAEIYKDKPEEFLKWTKSPGKKRPKMIQMPSMAHVAEDDINTIYTYVMTATKGVTLKKSKNGDPFATHPHTTRRPRIQRTFLPNTGPASLYVAMPGEAKLNLVWDTALCRLRYITEGEHDNWPYLRGNGNALTKVGDILYTEERPPFSLKSGSAQPSFRGYRINKDGLPTFLYNLGSIEIAETISGSDKTITRSFTVRGDKDQILLAPSPSGPLAPRPSDPARQDDTTTFTIVHSKD